MDCVSSFGSWTVALFQVGFDDALAIVPVNEMSTLETLAR